MKELIIGNKVILRELREEDAAFFAHWYSQPTVMFQCGFQEPTTYEAEKKRINRPEDTDEDWYAITDLTGKLLGEAGFLRLWKHWHCTDMSMIIPNPDDQGKGYGFEAGQLLLNKAFRYYNLNRVAVGVVELNTPAMKYWERLGFKKEGLQEQGYFHDGKFSDFVMMRILKSEYIGVSI
ncbi:MAG: GNAT family N-acetyltransferase [Defluviitaleaceae bacterium]|nr:GNAT family N-acetyltransferase [Defluviitaleaceae bacterium]